MVKFALIPFILFFVQNQVQTQLCSIAKANNKCICKRITNSEDNFAVNQADCSRIRLQNVPKLSQLFQDLKFLDLSHNEIEILKTEDDFSSSSLQTLILSYNLIASIDDGFFKQIPNLRKVILSHNKLTSLGSEEIFRNNSELKHLDLSFNNIKSLQNNLFLPLQNLQILDLSYNDLGLGEFLSQKFDFLSASLGLTINIIRLKLDNVGLKTMHNIYFSNYTNLKYLSLADNYFEIIPSIPYSVEYLDLSGSNVATLQAKYLNYHSLKTFKLDRMKRLETIHPYAFYNLQALEELSITDCWQLKEFNELVFGLLTKNTTTPLKKISLSKNGLQTLNYTYKFLFENLDFVDVSHNPWTCDCNLLWFQEIDNFNNKEYIQCSSPRNLNGKLISELTHKDVPSCFPEKYGKKSHRILIPILILLVIILAGLVAYLIYYAPSWYYGRTGRGISPDSPYSPTRTEEN